VIDLLDHIDKLEELFKRKYTELQTENSLRSLYDSENEFWVSYCDKHNVLLMHSEWVMDFFNNERKNKICISNPEEGNDACYWILVPEDFAEKVLVLNGLPD
jgi:tRNA(Ile)-lysidine synthase TilS/MesJ